jgi:hypothetical protein
MIDVSLIKQEVVLRVQNLASREDLSGSRLKQLISRLESTKDFAQELTDHLNYILKEKRIELDEQQKESLILDIKPTLIELMQGHILGKH